MTRLAQIAQIRSGYTRSINLEWDFYHEVDLSGYILTSTVQSALRRVGEGLMKSGGSRAWTVTGPYGSGKSAFCLFLANLLCPADSGSSGPAINLLKSDAYDLWQLYFDGRKSDQAKRLKGSPFWPILVTGGRESILQSLMRGVFRGLQYLNATQELEEARNLLLRVEEGHARSQEVIQFISRTAVELYKSDEISGVLIVADELGKNLEYASLNPDNGDLFVLQELAEKVQGRIGVPAVLIGLLHQVFDRYAERLTALERAEWAKIQGRFEDIAFHESTEQLLRLTARAIEVTPENASLVDFDAAANELAGRSVEVGLKLPGMTDAELQTILAQCFPLHPAAAIILGPLFRRLAQNERSLFAFLSSHEPHGFQEFLRLSEASPGEVPTYGLSQLYDYLWTSLGGALLSTPAGRQWAQIDSCLSRVGTEDPLRIAALKSIGLLQVAGEPVGLKPDASVLAFVLNLSVEETRKVLSGLRERALVTYRNFQDAYAVWEGSDFDLDAELHKARTHIRQDRALAKYLQELAPTRPLIAKRHSLEHGTLRHFDVGYVDVHGLRDQLAAGQGDADGRIIFVFPDDTGEAELVARLACEERLPKHILVGVPEISRTLWNQVRDLRALNWILKNQTDIAGDAAARREVLTHLADLQESIRHTLRGVLDATVRTAWYSGGLRLPEGAVSGRKSLNELLSRICDEVYCLTPYIPNELLTREHLSSSAAAARRNLIEGILERSHQESLGIVGHPAERSMYDAVLGITGLHVREGETWKLVPPAVEANKNPKAASMQLRNAGYQPNPTAEMGLVWRAIDEFMASTKGRRRPVEELFGHLGKPPFGIKSGPLPVLLCTYMKVHGAAVALYENDTFVPEPGVAHFERLMRAPRKFSVQFCRLDGLRGSVYHELRAMLQRRGLHTAAAKTSQIGELLDVVRPICLFVGRLPVYTRRTRTVTGIDAAVRDAVLYAQDPERLVFEDLPVACAVEPFLPEQADDSARVAEFVGLVDQAVGSLQSIYPRLLETLETAVGQAFRCTSTGSVRQQLRARLELLSGVPTDPRTRTFLLRVLDENLSDESWIESVATFLTTKPPSAWSEQDRATFDLGLAQSHRAIEQLEGLIAGLGPKSSRQNAINGKLLRIGVTSFGEGERERVLRLQVSECELVQELRQSVLGALGAARHPAEADLQLAALAEAALQIIADSEVPHRKREQLRLT